MRQTSIEAFNEIKNNGLLSQRRWEVYEALFNHGPCTANELRKHLAFKDGINVNLNVVTRLGELRNFGVVFEVRERQCSITGIVVIEWDVTDRLPIRFDKPKRLKCKYCNGKGYIEERQSKWDI